MRAAFIFQIGLLKKRARGNAAPSKAPTRSRSSGAEPGPETRRGSFSPLGCAAPPPQVSASLFAAQRTGKQLPPWTRFPPAVPSLQADSACS